MKISLVLLNYHSAADCVKSAEKFIKANNLSNDTFNVYIVNNGDSDSGANLLKEYSDENEFVSYIESDNSGYAKGNNLGIREAKLNGSTFALVANPDVSFSLEHTLKAIEMMKEELASDVACYAIEVEGLKQYSGYPSMLSILFPYWRRKKDHMRNLVPGQRIYRFHGCFFGVNLNCKFSDKAFFDEGTFLYFEEDIVALELEQRGLQVIHIPCQQVFHEGSAIVNAKIPFKKYKFQFESLKYLLQKHYKMSGKLSYVAAMCSMVVRFVVDLLKRG